MKGNVSFNIDDGRFVSIGKLENLVAAQNINSNSNILGENQENLKEYPFQMITKEKEKIENPKINDINKS